jgi:hypothetical protein
MLPSSGIERCVVSIWKIGPSDFGSWRWKRRVSSNRRLTYGLHDAISQKTATFITTVVRTSNSTYKFSFKHLQLLYEGAADNGQHTVPCHTRQESYAIYFPKARGVPGPAEWLPASRDGVCPRQLWNRQLHTETTDRINTDGTVMCTFPAQGILTENTVTRTFLETILWNSLAQSLNWNLSVKVLCVEICSVTNRFQSSIRLHRTQSAQLPLLEDVTKQCTSTELYMHLTHKQRTKVRRSTGELYQGGAVIQIRRSSKHGKVFSTAVLFQRFI